MTIDILVPEVGESISEGVLVEWLVDDGVLVQTDDPLFELETDKITMTVPAPATGVVRIEIAEGEIVAVGQRVGTLEEAPAGERSAEERPPQTPGEPAPPAAGPGQAVRKLDVDLDALAPSVRRLVAQHGLDPSLIPATGRDGRLIKADVIRYMEQALSGETADDDGAPTDGEARSSPTVADVTSTGEPAPLDAADVEEAREETPAPRPPRQTRRRMSALRARLAERLVASQRQTATLTTFNEVDLQALTALRARHKERFQERYGVRLGMMSFFIKAAVKALEAVPAVNAFLDGDDVVTNHVYDIGVAVSSDKGLVVPVLRDADRKSLAEIESDIADLARRAQERRLTLDDLTGGVFTVSNGGVFGSLFSTPILNPPQSAILGMHGIKKRPVVVDDEIVIRPMMYLALSYDHRIVDGREAVTFLRRIVECVQDPERLLMEVCDGSL